jgi:phage-related protein
MDARAAVRAMLKRRQQGRVPANADRKVLPPDVWELRVPFDRRAFRVLYTLIKIGSLRRAILVLTVYEKKSGKMPDGVKETTLARLADQRQRAATSPNG